VGGLDVERDWDDLLSLSEQQLLSAARIRLAAPKFAVLQGLRGTLDEEQAARVLELLSGASITYVAFGKADGSPAAYDAELEILGGGAWSWHTPARGIVA
jgi:putative ATP-binding cassette transporter